MRRIVIAALLFAALASLAACPRSSQPSPADAPAAAAEQAPVTAPVSPAPSDAPPPNAQGKRAAGQENEPVLAWRALGTEPFWHVRVDGATLVFSTPEDQGGRAMQGRHVPSSTGFVYAGRDGGKDFNLDIRPGECSDGMSDNRYEYEATFVYGGTTYQGCGEAAK